jgi:hypothetical protein
VIANGKVKMENDNAASSPQFGKKICAFSDLSTWKHARKSRQGIYRAASNLPADEKYSLASQLKRAAISVTANLAEGLWPRFLPGDCAVLPPMLRLPVRIEGSFDDGPERWLHWAGKI